MIQLFSNGGKNITINEYFYYQYYTYTNFPQVNIQP